MPVPRRRGKGWSAISESVEHPAGLHVSRRVNGGLDLYERPQNRGMGGARHRQIARRRRKAGAGRALKSEDCYTFIQARTWSTNRLAPPFGRPPTQRGLRPPLLSMEIESQMSPRS
jgi:hypothetical protein